MQVPKTVNDVARVVEKCSLPDKRFRVTENPGGIFVQIEYEEADVVTGDVETQRGRKWYLSTYATNSEIVQTCLTAALASAEHQVREHFRYQPHQAAKPRALYGPHFDADALYELASQRANYDAREAPPEEQG